MRTFRWWGYLVVALALLGLAMTGPHAWATPDQGPNPQSGTVPTVTPTATSKPSDPDGPTPLPPVTIRQCSPTSTSGLQLQVVAEPGVARPGATLHFTATVVNGGSVAASQVTLDVTLSEGLDPNPQQQGAPGVWSGRTLHAEVATLNAGQSLVVPFSVTISRTATPGSVLQLMTRAASADGWCADPQTVIPLPPAQLPTTGAE